MQTEEALTTQPEPTLREQIAENLSAVDSAAPPELTTSQPTAGSEAAVVESAEQKAGRLANRLRDETGKLLPGKKEEAQPDAKVVADPAVAPKRPSTWKKETWAVYDKLAAGAPLTADEAKMVVDTIHKRESDFANGVSTYKGEYDNARRELESAKPLLEAIAPFQQDLQQHNIAPADMVSRLFTAHKQLALGSPQDKLAMFQRLARDYGIPAQLAVQDQQGQWQLLAAQPQPQQQPQPQYQPQDIQRLVKQELQSERTSQTVAEFERNAPEHYATVKQDMAGLLQAGLADDLQSAYEAALRLPKHAEIFEAIQEQKRQDDEAKRLAEAKAKVTRARANAVSTGTATPGGHLAGGGDKSLRDQIATNLRDVVGGRV